MKGGKGAEGIAAAGHACEGFAFDCEGPCHEVLLAPHALASRPVSNGEWQEFIADGGYHTPALWLSDGWAWVQAEDVEAPAYWQGDQYFTLAGWHDIDPAAPVKIGRAQSELQSLMSNSDAVFCLKKKKQS